MSVARRAAWGGAPKAQKLAQATRHLDRLADLETGARRANELRLHLNQLLSNQPVEILASLRAARLQAAAFVAGKWIDNPEGQQRLALWSEAGHVLANHSYSHPSLPELSRKGGGDNTAISDRVAAGLRARTPYVLFVSTVHPRKNLDAVREMVKCLVKFKAGLNDPRRPLGVFLYCGPTGVGKTALARAMGDRLFPGKPEKEHVNGVINYVRDNTMVITVNGDDLPEWILDGLLGIDVMFDEMSYREMEYTLKEVIAKAKGAPGAMSFGHGGNGSTMHLSGELLNMLAGTKLQAVPYKGSGPVSADVLGGQVPLGVVDVPSAISNVRAGKLRALAVTSKRRISAAPEVPTFEEAGVPGYEAIGWFGVVGPAGLPRPIVERLNAEIRAALEDPAIRERALGAGTEPFTSSPEEFSAMIREETKKWAEVIKAGGIKLQ